jgi:PKD repeat protein
MKNIILVICSVVCLVACKKEDTQSAPIADFSFDKRNIGVGDTVMISNLTKNGYDKCYWTLPGSMQGTVDAPNKTYPVQYVKVGKFSVTLSVTNAAGSDEMTRPEYITVEDNRIKVTGTIKNDKNRDLSNAVIHIGIPDTIYSGTVVMTTATSEVVGNSYTSLIFRHYLGTKVEVSLLLPSSGSSYSVLSKATVILKENTQLDLTIN